MDGSPKLNGTKPAIGGYISLGYEIMIYDPSDPL